MPTLRHRFSGGVVRDDVLRRAMTRLRHELDVPDAFAADVEQEAGAAVDRFEYDRVDRRDLELVTIDPPGATDLDQALAIEATSDGHTVWYAIADVAAFLEPDGAVDRASRSRGVTLYAPDGRSPLHPTVLSEDRASLLPGQDRPAVLWRLDLDDDGGLVDASAERALVRSRSQLTYESAARRIAEGDPALGALRTVGERRIAQEAARGGVHLPVPEQEVDRVEGGYVLRYRGPDEVEEWNAQLSLLCGIAAASIMARGDWALLRTLPAAEPDALDELRRHAAALGVAWPDAVDHGAILRSLDPRDPTTAAFVAQAVRLFRGAGYLAVRPDVDPPAADRVHHAIAAEYAHVTAPLRRLGDRYATEIVLATQAGTAPPTWVVEALDDVPGEVQQGAQRAGALERATIAMVEALVLSDHVGQVFPAVAVSARPGQTTVQFTSPAIVGTAVGDAAPGSTVDVRVEGADPVEREIALALV